MTAELGLLYFVLHCQKNNYTALKQMAETISELNKQNKEKQKKLTAAISEKELLTSSRLYLEQIARNKLFLIKKDEFLLIPSRIKT